MRSIADIFRSYAVLNTEGKHINGTDKMSNHCYGYAYERILEGHRMRARYIMEIGIADGSSLLAWSEVFPNATCVGLDIHAPSRIGWGQFKKPRLEFYLGDQRSKEDCERAAERRLFDFICEDATHNLADSLLTLYWLWPSVAPGGIYVVEEWSNIDRDRIKALWPFAEIVDTVGPFGGIEPLVVFRKPL